MKAIVTILLLALARVPSAQTFVVDVRGGPGAHFTSIAAAVAAVPGGATLVVRPGTYQPFAVDAKGLSILAEAGVRVAGSSILRNTRVDQRVVVSGIDFSAATQGVGAVLHVHDCRGPVILTRITTPPSLPAEPLIASIWFNPRGLTAQRCDQLILRSCTIRAVALSDCTTVVDACVLRGSDAVPTPGLLASATEGLLLGGGRTEVVGATDLVGGDGLPGSNDAPGMQAVLSTVAVRSGTIQSGSGAAATPAWAAVAVDSAVRLAPTVRVRGGLAPPILGAVTFVDLPEVTCSGATPGTSAVAHVTTTTGDAVALLAGGLGAPWAVPGLVGRVWLDPRTAAVEAVGVQRPGTPVGSSLRVPTVGALRGVPLVWQALTLGVSGLRITNPTVVVVD